MKRNNSLIKILACILIVINIITFTGCNIKKSEGSKAESSKFDIKVANNLVENYMKALMRDDYEGAKKLYSSDVLKKTKDTGNQQNPNPGTTTGSAASYNYNTNQGKIIGIPAGNQGTSLGMTTGTNNTAGTNTSGAAGTAGGASSAQGTNTGSNTNQLRVRGYSVDETSEIGQSGFFKVKVARSDLNRPSAVLDETSIKVKQEGAEYKISDVKNDTDKEAFFESNALRLRSKNNVNTNLIIDVGSLPQYTFSKDDKANLNKQPIPKDAFSIMAFGYEGERLAISTYGKNGAYIGIVKIDESQATQGGGGGGGGGQGGGGQGGGGGGGQGGGGQQGGSNTQPREKPIGKEMTSLDLLPNTRIDFLTFSMGEKYLLAQFTKQGSGSGKSLRVYSTDSGELIPFKFEDKYPMGKVDVIFSSFDKDVLNYEVIPAGGGSNNRNTTEYTGRWQLSLKDFKTKKL